MSSNASLPDRLRQTVQAVGDRRFAAEVAHLLSPATEEEHSRRRAHLLALLLVAIVSTIKHVTGVTDGSAQYTV
jgi:hypothetical protein